MDFNYLFEKTFHEALKLLQKPSYTEKDFCHYTNLQGLIGIVENNELWLSDHRFVNDKLEYEYGKQLAVSELSEIINSKGDSEFSRFVKKLRESIQKPSSKGIYIGSMSLSTDKLDQWKGYGNGGESICIKFDGDYKRWNTGSSPTHIRQQRVIYQECEQRNLIRSFVQIFEGHFDKFQQFSDPFLTDLIWLIENQFILFKHPEYASEDELRLTIANLDSKEPKHRVSKGMIIPYISTKDINPTPTRLPIMEIIVSPTSRPDLLESVRIFVENMGYRNVKVVESRIKFRG